MTELFPTNPIFINSKRFSHYSTTSRIDFDSSKKQFSFRIVPKWCTLVLYAFNNDCVTFIALESERDRMKKRISLRVLEWNAHFVCMCAGPDSFLLLFFSMVKPMSMNRLHQSTFHQCSLYLYVFRLVTD